jgi:nucleoid DNA-binding protein
MNANKFTRADIAKTITDTGIERATAGAIALAIVQAMADALTAGKVIELRGFGSLEVRKMGYTERTAMNTARKNDI